MSGSPLSISDIFHVGPDPDNPDWTLFQPIGEERFNHLFGPIRVKPEGPARARCRVDGAKRHLNINGDIHGGFALALIDQVMFLGTQTLGMKGALAGKTLDVSAQFFGPLQAGMPIDAVIDVLRETGRFIFIRGLLEQDGKPSVAFSGTARKASAR